MAYNVENLFDTINNPLLNDDEFLPQSERQWNTYRYWAKLGRLARGFAMAGGETPVDLIGLCEVEGDSVLTDLCRRTYLNRLDYNFISSHGNDARGINVALLYQPLRFKLLGSQELEVFPADEEHRTRNILLVSGLLQGGDTLDVFVCHLPSKRGGAKVSEPRRIKAAQIIRTAIDSLLTIRQTPCLLLMGDFNEEADAKIFQKVLQTKSAIEQNSAAAQSDGLYLLSHNKKADDNIHGSYYFQKRWRQIDHIIVSGNLLNGKAKLRTSYDACRILTHPMLLEQDKAKVRLIPKRTYLGPHYHGGISDHLPMVVDFVF